MISQDTRYIGSSSRTAASDLLKAIVERSEVASVAVNGLFPDTGTVP